MPLAIDSSSVLWSVEEIEREEALATRPLLVVLHGLGSHEGDLFGLAPLFPPEFVVASLRAPLLYGGGYSWYPMGTPGAPDAAAVDASVDAVLAWLDSLALPVGAPIALLGFSQGGAMTLQLLRHDASRFIAFVCLAAFLTPGERPDDAALESSKPQVFWGRGLADPIIGAAAVERTAAWLPSHSTLTLREYPGLAHTISQEEIDDVVKFLTASLT